MKQIIASMTLGLASLSWPLHTEAGGHVGCDQMGQEVNLDVCSFVNVDLSSPRYVLDHLGRVSEVIVILDEESTRPSGPLSAASQFHSLPSRTSIETISKVRDRLCPFTCADPDDFISSIELGGKSPLSDIDPDSGLAVPATYIPEPLRLLLLLIELACVGTELGQRLRGKAD